MLNKKIIEKYNMFTNVNQVLNDNPTTVGKVPAFETQSLAFRADYGLLAAIIQPLQLDSKGNAKAKQATEVELSRVLAGVCGAMKSYAEDKNDLVLLAKVNYSPTALTRQRDLVLQETSDALYKLANGLAAQLVPYGVDAAILSEINTLVQRYKVQNPMVRSVIVANKTSLEGLNKRVTDLNNMLRRKLDNSVKIYQFMEPDFFTLYNNARRNYSLPTQHESDTEMAAAKKQLNAIKKEITTEKKQAAAKKAKEAKKAEENAKINAETAKLTDILADLKLNKELNNNVEPVEKNSETDASTNGVLENGHAV